MSQDAVSVEIFANLFKAVVDEMAWILLFRRWRCMRSSSIRGSRR